jgi:hypothetical protein
VTPGALEIYKLRDISKVPAHLQGWKLHRIYSSSYSQALHTAQDGSIYNTISGALLNAIFNQLLW